MTGTDYAFHRTIFPQTNKQTNKQTNTIVYRSVRSDQRVRIPGLREGVGDEEGIHVVVLLSGGGVCCCCFPGSRGANVDRSVIRGVM